MATLHLTVPEYKRSSTENSPQGTATDTRLVWEDLIYVCDLVLSSGQKNLSLSLGDTKVHEDAVQMIEYVVARGIITNVVFSEIDVDSEWIADMMKMANLFPNEILSFVWTVDSRLFKGDITRLEIPENFREFLERSGDRTSLECRLLESGINVEKMVQAINGFALKRDLKLAIGHPVAGSNAPSLSLDDVKSAIDSFFAESALLDRFRIRVLLDCGFPMCLMQDQHLAWLVRQTPHKIFTECEPKLEIGPDLSVWACYPLAHLQNKLLFDFDSLAAAYDFYRHVFRRSRLEACGVYQWCDDCPSYESFACRGGCLAHNISRFQDEPGIRVEEVYLP